MSTLRCVALLLVISLAGMALAAQTPVAATAPSEADLPLLEQLNSLRLLGRYEDGIELATSALAKAPSTPRLHYALGILYGLSNRHAEALGHFESELELDSAHVESYRGKAAALKHLGRATESLASLERARLLAPDDPALLTELGKAFSRAGAQDKARATLERALDLGAGPSAAVELSLLLRQGGELDRAAALLRATLQRHPSDTEVLFSLGQSLIALGDFDAGSALLERHAELAALLDEIDVLERSSRLPGATALNFLRLADAQLRFGDSEGAEGAFRRALQLDPEAVAALLGLSGLALREGNTVAATQWAVHALLTQPKDWRPHFQLGLLRLTKGEHESAGEAFAASLAAQPWESETHRHCGEAYQRVGLFEEAAEHHERALALNASNYGATLGLALARLALGRDSEAAALLDAAHSTRPGDPLLLVARALVSAGDDGQNWSEPAVEKATQALRGLFLRGQSAATFWSELAGIPRAGMLRSEIDRRLALP